MQTSSLTPVRLERPNRRVRWTFTSVRPYVLLADDDPDMRGTIADALRDDGCDVTEVPDGGRLLIRMATEGRSPKHHDDAFDIIVSDVRMPFYSGLDVLEKLRETQDWQTPVILMTAFSDDRIRARAEQLGAVLFQKPFEIDDLKTAIVNMAHPPRR